MKAIIERCTGIDVGKKFITACILIGSADMEPTSEKRLFGIFNADLEALRIWLLDRGCTHVVMESTSPYWKPIFNILEENLTVVLANSEQVKARRGHKTDRKDCAGLAELLRHGLVRPSFIPPRPVRELRDLTRRRKRILGDASSERNRVQKVLEDGNIKLGSVLTDVFGASGQLMLQALLEGKSSAREIAELARGTARKKIPAITEALQSHRMTDHHRSIIRLSVEHMRFLEQQLQHIDQEILGKIKASGFQHAFELLQSIPGVQQDSAATILAEIGPDASPFPSAGHLSSWAGVCPGNHRSAGKEKDPHINHGNRWLRTTLVECAWAASAKKHCFLRDRFWRLAAGSRKRALVAIAHALLILIYNALRPDNLIASEMRSNWMRQSGNVSSGITFAGLVAWASVSRRACRTMSQLI
jgi:transposase